MRSKLSSSVVGAGIALLFTTFSVNPAAAGLMDQIQKLAGPSTPSPAAAPAITATTPLGKFAASGRVTETLDTGACAGSLAASLDCTPATNCVQVQFSGPVNAAGLGKSNLAACITVDNTAVSPNLNVCFDGLGTGTITSANGKNSITLAMGGLLCAADEFPLPTPTSALFVLTSTYAVEGGTGSFATGVGSGNVSLSALIAPITTPPFAATGQINFTGTLAKH